MKLPHPGSFAVGFLTALVLGGVVYLWGLIEFRGGLHRASPSGAYELSVMAPLSPTSGGSYRAELVDCATSRTVRSVVVTLPQTGKTVALRGGRGTIAWDPGEGFADVKAGGSPIVRVYVPSMAPKTSPQGTSTRPHP